MRNKLLLGLVFLSLITFLNVHAQKCPEGSYLKSDSYGLLCLDSETNQVVGSPSVTLPPGVEVEEPPARGGSVIGIFVMFIIIIAIITGIVLYERKTKQLQLMNMKSAIIILYVVIGIGISGIILTGQLISYFGTNEKYPEQYSDFGISAIPFYHKINATAGSSVQLPFTMKLDSKNSSHTIKVRYAGISSYYMSNCPFPIPQIPSEVVGFNNTASHNVISLNANKPKVVVLNITIPQDWPKCNSSQAFWYPDFINLDMGFPHVKTIPLSFRIEG